MYNMFIYYINILYIKKEFQGFDQVNFLSRRGGHMASFNLKQINFATLSLIKVCNRFFK